jgi:hypothetical protein
MFTHTSVEDSLRLDWLDTVQLLQSLFLEEGNKIITLIPWAVS